MALVDVDMARLRELTPPKGPIVMLNLYRFKTPEDHERFKGTMSTLVGPEMDRLGVVSFSATIPWLAPFS